MKSLKSILFITALSLISTFSFSQKKVSEIKIKVDGVCEMCKTRIEAALDINGIKYANWDIETKMLSVAFRNDKYSEENICEILALAGHDTEKVKADEEVYNAIDACCKYRDPQVIEDHKN